MLITPERFGRFAPNFQELWIVISITQKTNILMFIAVTIFPRWRTKWWIIYVNDKISSCVTARKSCNM